MKLDMSAAEEILRRFNPNHAAAGSATGGQFTSAGSSSSKTAPPKAPAKPPAKNAAKTPAHGGHLPSTQPNGLGYTAAEWRHLQELEAKHKAGGKLSAHELHELHVAHEKHVAHAAREAHLAHEKHAAAIAAAEHHPAHHAGSAAAAPAAPKRAPVNTTNKYSAGHPVKAI